MIRRCENPKHSSYKHYGAKGIRVCAKWKSFREFSKWALANGYQEHLTIDRLENSLGYEESNCRWATWKQQAANRTPRAKLAGEVPLKRVRVVKPLHPNKFDRNLLDTLTRQ